MRFIVKDYDYWCDEFETDSLDEARATAKAWAEDAVADGVTDYEVFIEAVVPLERVVVEVPAPKVSVCACETVTTRVCVGI